jgi:hypothetical protein
MKALPCLYTALPDVRQDAESTHKWKDLLQSCYPPACVVGRTVQYNTGAKQQLNKANMLTSIHSNTYMCSTHTSIPLYDLQNHKAIARISYVLHTVFADSTLRITAHPPALPAAPSTAAASSAAVMTRPLPPPADMTFAAVATTVSTFAHLPKPLHLAATALWLRVYSGREYSSSGTCSQLNLHALIQSGCTINLPSV